VAGLYWFEGEPKGFKSEAETLRQADDLLLPTHAEVHGNA
jgi:hypothetical protein